MARKIAVTLRKGGSGKTTTALNLAAGLRLLGQRVLLVDLDPQANATLAAGLDPTALPSNINHLFTAIDTPSADVVTQTAFGLPILPAHPDLAATESGMKATQIGVLRGLLEPLEEDYEPIVLYDPRHQGAQAYMELARRFS